MKIIVTKKQLKNIISESKKHKEINFKPAVIFDQLYGTKLSKQYDFSPYTEEQVWDYWVECRDFNNCEKFEKTFDVLPKIYPYIDTTNLPYDIKKDIMLGAASGFNPEDIYHFSVKRIFAIKNFEQKELEKQLPPGVARNIQWVLSPKSIQQIKMKFGIV